MHVFQHDIYISKFLKIKKTTYLFLLCVSEEVEKYYGKPTKQSQFGSAVNSKCTRVVSDEVIFLYSLFIIL